jgi:hypothetical protein
MKKLKQGAESFARIELDERRMMKFRLAEFWVKRQVGFLWGG